MSPIRIISRSGEPFLDRAEAADLLLAELGEFQGRRPVVLGIPRGGVVIAARLAAGLGGELDIVLSRKLGPPGNPELAIGAVSEDGHVVAEASLLARLGIRQEYLGREKERQMAEIHRRVDLYRAAAPKVPLAGREVIVTDDGLATGATMQAALWSVRRERPGRLIAAVPVAPEDTLRRLAPDADLIICLRVPPWFSAVGQFYRSFDQVEDAEVLSLLKSGRRKEGGDEERSDP